MRGEGGEEFDAHATLAGYSCESTREVCPRFWTTCGGESSGGGVAVHATWCRAVSKLAPSVVQELMRGVFVDCASPFVSHCAHGSVNAGTSHRKARQRSHKSAGRRIGKIERRKERKLQGNRLQRSYFSFHPGSDSALEEIIVERRGIAFMSFHLIVERVHRAC